MKKKKFKKREGYEKDSIIDLLLTVAASQVKYGVYECCNYCKNVSVKYVLFN